MADKRVRYGPLWLVFLAATFTGAALVLRPEPGLQALGLALILLPAALIGLVLLAYYVRSRRLEEDADTEAP